uniref:Spermatogenesis associated 48 n=1 Tax=Varanus komodoensis TaxID=61221 RepID=A0A8D2KVU6_VARKO
MASQVTARHFCPVKHLNPVDSLHKMHRKQYEGLLRKMYMPFVRGPEDKHSFASFQDKNSNAFLKSNPFIPPEDKHYILAPHRDDVPGINAFSGFVSPGAEAEQQIKYGKSLRNDKDWQPPGCAPVPLRRVQTADGRRSLQLEEIKQDHRWNSRAVPDISIRSKIGGWTSPVKVLPAPPQTKECFSPHTFAFNVDPDAKVILFTALDSVNYINLEHIFKSMSLWIGYEEVPWDKMLPPKCKPPDSTLEPMPDCVSQCFTRKRYEPVAEISQVKKQASSFALITAIRNSLFQACAHLINSSSPLTFLLSSPNTFGYTGKVHWSATQPVNSNLPPTSPSIISRMYGYLATHGHPTEFPHLGPLSQILTPTEPQNSFNKKERERVSI